MREALTAIRSTWKSMIELGITGKKEFQKDAEECVRFFDGPYDFMYGLREAGERGDFIFTGAKKMPRPSVAMTVNKVAEGVQLFGPTLYHRNPIRKVSPRKLPEIPIQVFGDPNDPQTMAMFQPLLQQTSQGQMKDFVRALLLEEMLLYTPTATNLKDASRRAIDEGIIKGMGILWHEMDKTPGSPYKLTRNCYDTVDNLILDPDGETQAGIKWVSRRRIEPVWEVETKFGHEPGTLRGNYESHTHSSAVEQAGQEYKKLGGKTNDLLVYWEIWSKMGMGALLRGISKDAAQVDHYGQYVYIAVCETHNFPINLPESIWQNDEEMKRRCQWETPFWCDRSLSWPWPFSPIIFHDRPRKVWPMSHFRPAMGELKFINWTYSFLASGIQKRSRDFICILKAASEELKSKILEGTDLELLELEASMGTTIDQVVKFLQHPEMHADLIPILERVEKNFEQRTGLTPLIYGETHSVFRSAEEANVKQQNLSIRPDDMRNKVEDWMTEVARKEALMLRWHMEPQDIAHIWGDLHASVWQEFVCTADIWEIVDALEYRIEAGSTKKPNKEADQQNATQMIQQLFAPLFQFAMQTGNVGPVNALLTFWGKSNDMDISQMLLPVPPPPQPMPQQQPQPQNQGPVNAGNGPQRNGQPQQQPAPAM